MIRQQGTAISATNDRVGRYYLRQRPRRNIEICWTDESGATHSVSAGTTDRRDAQAALAAQAAHAVKSGEATPTQLRVRDPKLTLVLMYYRLKKGDRFASRGTFDMAVRDVLEICGDITVSQYDVPRQVAFAGALRARGLSDASIARRLRALRPAFVRAWGDGLLKDFPPTAHKRDWTSQVQSRPAPSAQLTACNSRNRFAQALGTAGGRMGRVIERLLMDIGTAVAAIAKWSGAGLRTLKMRCARSTA